MMKQKSLAMIAAMGKNRVIGSDGGIPWHYPEDMRYFRKMTLDHAILMGRVTMESLKGPLKKRHNLVLSRQPLDVEGFESFTSWDDMLERAQSIDDCPFVIGGTQIYKLAFPFATHLHLTVIDDELIKGDTFFPEFSTEEWELVKEEKSGPLTFQTWTRPLE